MSKAVQFLVAVVSLFFIFGTAEAQFGTPAVDGVISPNEYGVHIDGQNQQGTGSGQTWYLTWNNTNLYVAVTNANLAEGAVLAIDRNPVSPPNGGTNADGTLNALNYDSTAIGTLPFRADFRAYFKDGYRDYQTANGANGWNFGASGFGAYASGAGNVREFAIPWSTITGGGRPSSFLFTAYLSSGGGYIYGQVPSGNAGGTTPGNWNRYFAVVDTNDTTSTKPFSLDQTISSDDIQFSGLKHDTFDGYYRSPFGAVTTGSTVNLKFRTALLDVSNVYLKVYKYNPQTNTTDPAVEYPMAFLENRTEGATTYAIYSVNYAAPATPSIIYYKFRIVDGTATAFYSDDYLDDHDNLKQGGTGAASAGEPFDAFQLTVYDANFTTPAWIHDAAVYQIFPDRFRNGDQTNDWCRPGSTTGCPSLYGGAPASNIFQGVWNTLMVDPRATGNNNAYGAQFYGGDLKGVQDKLDYIKGMGFDTIYLNPIFKARSNHGYDTDDYLAIAPQLGGDAAFQSLVAAANARGMKIILDGVWNHMSQDSEYFDYYGRSPVVGACESLASPYRSWFNFYNSNAPCTTADYEGWFGFGGLPAFNENAAVKDFFYRTPTTNVTQYWYDRGAGGWRFDVAPDISHQWWNEYRGYAKSYKSDGPLIGEIFFDASQYLAGDQLDGVMNYRFRKNVLGFARGFDWEDNDNSGGNKIAGLTPSQFDRAMLAIREDYPLPAQQSMLNLIDSHDTNRALYTLKNSFESQSEAKDRLKLAAVFQFAYIGAPMVYYGDEAGINAPSLANNGSGLPEDDPYNRAPYPWADEAGDASVYGPADSSLISFYAALGVLRRGHPALRTGNYATLLTGDTTASGTDDNTFAFVRYNANEKIVVVMNNGTTANTAQIPVGAYFADGTVLNDVIGGGGNNFAPAATYTVTGGTITVTVPARSSAIVSNFVPTAAGVAIGGRVTDAKGRGLTGVRVSLTDARGAVRTATTNSFGFYGFKDVPAGETLIVNAQSKRLRIENPTRVLTVDQEQFDIDFTASE
ncbi:MAG: carboxypeptidase regulatory-like domain-containing protein [Acidobacteria bacterium]|nr:carboxypeptidase regulatory-like domain-containing protein [Acidobacteriota bacterium]